MTTPHVDILSTESAIAELEPEWERLEQRTGNALPFTTAAWTRAWATHLAARRRTVRDRLAVHALRDATTWELVGVAPMVVTDRPAFGPVRVRVLQFVGADPNITEVRGPLFLPERARDCWDALVTRVRERDDCSWIVWSGVEDVARGSLGGAPVTWTREVPYYLLDLPASWDALKTALPRNVKESLRKCYNAPKREGVELRFEVVRDRAPMASAIEDFLRLHGMRAQRDDTIRHADVFAAPSARAFLGDVVDRFAAKGRARAFRLLHGDRVVATRIGFSFGDTLYLYYSGYDPEYARFSVMTRAVAEAIQYAIAEGLRTVNLSTGTDVSKTRWNPRSITVREGTEHSPTPRARAVRAAFALASRAAERPVVADVATRLFARRPT